MSPGGESVLRVRGLSVATTTGKPTPIVDGIDLDIALGQTVALVGESGSGKSMTARALLRLLPPNLAVEADVLEVAGHELANASEAELRAVRGDRVGMVFQDPMANFNPVVPVGVQVVEPLLIRKRMSRKAARELATEALGHVGIPRPEERVREYPHQFSGGMLQRAMIAMALINKPRLIIADEPTTALDATLQVKIVELLRSVQEEVGAGILLITHDLGLVSELADAAAVMYGGRIMERGVVQDVFSTPSHPYTRALLESRPERGRRIRAIAGEPATPANRPGGCVFHPRCQVRQERSECVDQEPVLVQLGSGQQSACHFAQEVVQLGRSAPDDVLAEESPAAEQDNEQPILRVDDVSKQFRSTSFWSVRARHTVQAVDRVSLEVRRGETLGLVGESGSGKSTLGRIMIGLLKADEGSVDLFNEQDELIPVGDGRRRTIQWVHQDPYGSLNPKMMIGDLVEEVLVRYGLHRGHRNRRIEELLSQVGMSQEMIRRYPHQLSGGQRQRVSIARALAVEPKLLVLDEPLSALDVSIQAQVLNLLSRLRRELGLSYVLISHDLHVVRAICDRVAVMYKGELVEVDEAERIYADPQHEYTKTLLAAMLGAGVGTESDRRLTPVEG
ncbi:MAG: dipeptide ABC transporter ATP-binding protein [Propionibacteriaceae bacterium]